MSTNYKGEYKYEFANVKISRIRNTILLNNFTHTILSSNILINLLYTNSDNSTYFSVKLETTRLW